MAAREALATKLYNLATCSRREKNISTLSQPQSWTCRSCLRQRQHIQRRFVHSEPADSPTFESILDRPAKIIRSGKRHNKIGLAILAAIPLTAIALGTWQVQRLYWKTELIARFEDRLIRPPLPLPLRIDQDAVKEFDYRRVYATGKLRHDMEMLVGPRLHDGDDGYLVITPLDREEVDAAGNKRQSRILVCRGWIPKKMADKRLRQKEGGVRALPAEDVTVQGLLREPWKKNMFTPVNDPSQNKWYFPDILEMAQFTGSQPVWIEETMAPSLIESYDREAKGIPIGRAAEVNLRNNHLQYIFTWYGLAAATSIMFWMVVKKPASAIRSRVRQSREW